MKYVKYEDDKGYVYEVGCYMGNDSAKYGKFHVCRIDGNFNRHTATPKRLNPWTTECEAEQNLKIMAELKGWKEL